jgi:hypothetical protein
VADVHHVVSLGVGSPAAIPQFLLFGLSPTGEIDLTLAACATLYVSAESPLLTMDAETPTLTMTADTPLFVLGSC